MNAQGIQLGTFELRTSQRLHRLIHLRDLVIVLVGRNLKAQYKNSVLGDRVVATESIAAAAGFHIPLPQSHLARYSQLRNICLRWPLIVVVVSTLVVQATSAVTTHRELVRRPGFPAAILPIITITTNLMNLLLALPLLVLFVILGGGHITMHFLELPRGHDRAIPVDA